MKRKKIKKRVKGKIEKVTPTKEKREKCEDGWGDEKYFKLFLALRFFSSFTSKNLFAFLLMEAVSGFDAKSHL